MTQLSQLPESDFIPGINLSIHETATLAAIACFQATENGEPCPLAVLQACQEKPEPNTWYRFDLTSPGRLARLGLIDLLGTRECRFYAITPEGISRLQR